MYIPKVFIQLASSNHSFHESLLSTYCVWEPEVSTGVSRDKTGEVPLSRC